MGSLSTDTRYRVSTADMLLLTAPACPSTDGRLKVAEAHVDIDETHEVHEAHKAHEAHGICETRNGTWDTTRGANRQASPLDTMTAVLATRHDNDLRLAVSATHYFNNVNLADC